MCKLLLIVVNTKRRLASLRELCPELWLGSECAMRLRGGEPGIYTHATRLYADEVVDAREIIGIYYETRTEQIYTLRGKCVIIIIIIIII